MTPSPWYEAITGFDVFAIILMTGGVTAALWLSPPGTLAGTLRRNIRQRLRLFVGSTLGLLTLTTIAIPFARGVNMSGVPLSDAGYVIVLVIMRTDFGRMWLVRAGAVILVWLTWSQWRTGARRSFMSLVLLALIAIIAFTRSATGHAGDHGDFHPAVWVDWLHLLAAGLWGGVIVAFVVAVQPLLHRDLDTHINATAAVVRRFSTIAAIGLGLAAATGIYNAWRALDDWQALWTSHYGHILDVKLALVILMALLGATNRFRHVPRIAKAARDRLGQISSLPRSFRLLATTTAAEALLTLAILAAVALLLHAMPPAALP